MVRAVRISIIHETIQYSLKAYPINAAGTLVLVPKLRDDGGSKGKSG